MLFYKPGLENVSGGPIGIILNGCGMFPILLGCLSNGCNDDREMHGLPMGASEEGVLHLVMDANVSKPIQCLLPFCLITFSFKRIVGGHCPGVVTSGESVTHKNFTEMRRLTRDETPFLLVMTPRETTLAW
jgi:hypothetical protein